MLFGWVVTLRAEVVDPALGLLVGKRAYASAIKSVSAVLIAYKGRRCTRDSVNIMDAAMVATAVDTWNGCGGQGDGKQSVPAVEAMEPAGSCLVSSRLAAVVMRV